MTDSSLPSKEEVLNSLRSELSKVEREIFYFEIGKSPKKKVKNETYHSSSVGSLPAATSATSKHGQRSNTSSKNNSQKHEARLRGLDLHETSPNRGSRDRTRRQPKIMSEEKAGKLHEYESIARNLEVSEIESLSKSHIIQAAMAQLGITMDDILPGLQETKLHSIPLTPMVKKHLEKRRIETLSSLLMEREYLAEALKQRPRTTEDFLGSKTRKAFSPERKREICEDTKQRLQARDKHLREKYEKVQAWDKKKEQERLELQKTLDEQISRSKERAQQLVEEKKTKVREVREKKANANVKARVVQAALENRRKVHWQKKMEEAEERRLRVTLEKSSTFDLQLLKRSKPSDLSEDSLKLLDQAQLREEHRQRVRDEARKKVESREQALLKLQEAKNVQMNNIQKKIEEKVEIEKEKRRLADIDRMLKLERLHRQDQYKKQLAQRKIEGKIEYGKSMEELVADLRSTKSNAEKLKFIEHAKSPLRGGRDGPGPGAYDLSSGLSERSFSMGSPKAEKNEEEKVLEATQASPGPGEYYDNFDEKSPSSPHLRPGVAFTKGKVMSEIDWVEKRARATPGPDAYDPVMMGKKSPSFSLKRQGFEELERARSSLVAEDRPGPSHYNPK